MFAIIIIVIYNLTFCKFGDQNVDCIIWCETEGKPGNVEIATCVYKYISNKQGITPIIAVRKNNIFIAIYSVTNNPTIHTIDHMF